MKTYTKQQIRDYLVAEYHDGGHGMTLEEAESMVDDTLEGLDE